MRHMKPMPQPVNSTVFGQPSPARTRRNTTRKIASAIMNPNVALKISGL